MNFTFLEVNNNSLLEQVYAFRYKIVFNEYQEYIKTNNLQNKKELDIYDPYSVHFAALDRNNRVCATVRLIYNSPIGYPTEDCLVFKNDEFDRDKLGEMSRIFIDTKYRNMKNTKTIIDQLKKLTYLKMMSLGIEYTYGSLEASLLRLLKIYKMRYTIIGDRQTHKFMCTRYPCILYTKQLGTDNPELIELWEKQNEV